MPGVRQQKEPAMKPHPRIRKTVKWGGAVGTVLLLVLWVASARLEISFAPLSEYDGFAKGGTVQLRSLRGGGPNADSFIFYVAHRFKPAPPFQWNLWAFSRSRGGSWVLAFPIWAPLIVAAVSTGIVWRLDIAARRRSRANACPNCNYDRTGLAPAAVCPECGSKGNPS